MTNMERTFNIPLEHFAASRSVRTVECSGNGLTRLAPSEGSSSPELYPCQLGQVSFGLE